MNAMMKQILNDIKYKGKVPMMVETADRVFIMDWVTKHRVSGYVCGIIGDYRSKFKQVTIQKTQSGKRFIVADRVRFDADEIKPCTIAREIVEKELTLSISMKETYLDIKRQGHEIGYSVENEDYYIQNLKNYLERSEHHE